MGFVVNFMHFPDVKNFVDMLAFDRVRARIKIARFLLPMV